MDRYERLLCEVGAGDIIFVETDSDILPANTLRIGGDYAIFFNEIAFETRSLRFLALAHEKAHCDTGALYSVYTPLMTRGRCEQRAWRRTVIDRLPPDMLMDAFEACKTFEGVTLYDLSEYLDMPEEFIKYAIDLYATLGKKIL